MPPCSPSSSPWPGGDTSSSTGNRRRRVLPGTAFIALIPSRHRYYLPQESPGWTFGWVSIYHPYLIARMAKQVAATGPVVELAPDGQLRPSPCVSYGVRSRRISRTASRPSWPMFEFLVAYEQARATNARHAPTKAGVCWKRSVRASLQDLTQGPQRRRAGGRARHEPHPLQSLLPVAHRCHARALRRGGAHTSRHAMLLDTRTPLKQVALDCGFANANYFSKVFRRFQHMSPAAYRRALG